MGTEKSKGTKTFAIAGDVKNTGLIEVPLGITLREVIYDVGAASKTTKASKRSRSAARWAAACRRNTWTAKSTTNRWLKSAP
jgi:NADH:ubiquinone oxidoreductase subunit F (NADH-binding)